jgi:hypothetical protein
MAMAVALRRLSKGRLPTAFRTAQGALAASAFVSPSRFSSAVPFFVASSSHHYNNVAILVNRQFGF